MTDEREPESKRHAREDDYRLARIAVGGGMSFLLAILLLFDALSPDYTIQATTLTVIVTMVLVLFGIEVSSLYRGGK